jgi:hypothetical protein
VDDIIKRERRLGNELAINYWDSKNLDGNPIEYRVLDVPSGVDEVVTYSIVSANFAKQVRKSIDKRRI